MSAKNAFSIVMPAETLLLAAQKLTGLHQLLHPYLRALTPEERQGFVKMHDHAIPFFRKAVVYARAQPQFAPPFMELDELEKDMNAVAGLTPLFYLAAQLHSNLEDTMLLCGSEAYLVALGYYHSVKRAAGMNVPGAAAIYDDLRQRLHGRVQEQVTLLE